VIGAAVVAHPLPPVPQRGKPESGVTTIRLYFPLWGGAGEEIHCALRAPPPLRYGSWFSLDSVHCVDAVQFESNSRPQPWQKRRTAFLAVTRRHKSLKS
jgi:hypothetical protein